MPPARDARNTIKDLFTKLDTDGNGKIDKKELGVLVRGMFGMNPDEKVPDELLTAIMTEADKDKSGHISQDELVGAVDCMAFMQMVMMLDAVFNDIDKDGNGYLTKDELVGVVKQHSSGNDQKKLASALGEVPDDTKISKKQFITMCLAQIAG